MERSRSIDPSERSCENRDTQSKKISAASERQSSKSSDWVSSSRMSFPTLLSITEVVGSQSSDLSALRLRECVSQLLYLCAILAEFPVNLGKVFAEGTVVYNDSMLCFVDDGSYQAHSLAFGRPVLSTCGFFLGT